ncbi:MAG: hypothetical protein LBP55_07900 [Candidatus Adiutrix sp.]|jgi:hypothetical protein|nr:hypothetical protein [Candidatus Adiutrix sp.]
MVALSLSQLQIRREEICSEIRTIDTMCKGTFNEIYYNSTLKDGSVRKRGPFYNLTMKEKGKTVSRAVPKAEVEKTRQEVANYQLFRRLSDEYIEVCEQISTITQTHEEVKKTELFRGVYA